MNEQNQEFLAKWQREKGRPLRVLHIGNIANNAYNNAKIQRRFGVDAYVLCFDYYHIMACPEWEDANFSGVITDQTFPDWWAVDLGGFERPRWFAQGPFDASIRYLLAETKSSGQALGLWRWLQFERWLLCRKSNAQRLARLGIRLFSGRWITYITTPANAVLLKRAGRMLLIASRPLVLRRTTWGSRIGALGRKLSAFGKTADLAFDSTRHLLLTRHRATRSAPRVSRHLRSLSREKDKVDLNWFYIWWYHHYIRLLFSRFDIVQCYATYTAMPFVAEHANYLAYEHGTLRSIPFQDTDEGRMCAASYKAAAAVFLTNTDNLEAAQKLALEPRRTICLPHAFDSDKLLSFAASHIHQKPAAADTVVFLTPTRQHWVDQDPGWAKGNDRVFDALKIVKDSGRHCVVRAVAWGNDLAASKARIAQLGIGMMVEWVPTMKKRELWSAYLEAHAVIDQFVVPAMGGVTFEAMMLGRRVLSAIDDRQAAQFFGRSPPIYNCSTSAEIAAAMIKVIDDPLDGGRAGLDNQDWMQTYHSASRIVGLQLDVYARVSREPRHDA